MSMDQWINVFVKVMLFHSASYAVYWVFMRRSTAFELNRTYLMVTFALAFIAPFVSILPAGEVLDPAPLDISVIPGIFDETTSEFSQQRKSGIHLSAVAVIIYLGGVSLLSARCVLSLFAVRKAFRSGFPSTVDGSTIVRTSLPSSFSFVNLIFLHHSAGREVFLHEAGHVRGKHWLDLFILEIGKIICWINPFVWVYSRSVRQQHEYLADRFALEHGLSLQTYLGTLLSALTASSLPGPVNEFNSQSLKQRIHMMTTQSTFPFVRFFYLLSLPLVAFLFVAFSLHEVPYKDVSKTRIIVIDAAHGGTDNGASAASGLKEKEITLSIARLVQQIGAERGLNVLLTRSTDQSMSLDDRVAFSTRVASDVFVSIHADNNKDGKSGPRLHVSEQNMQYAESTRLAGMIEKELSGNGSPVIQNSNAYVLKKNQAAAVILEIGNLASEPDVQALSDADTQRQLAEHIVNGLAGF